MCGWADRQCQENKFLKIWIMLRNLLKKYLVTGVALLGLQFAQGQDLHFSQFFEAPILRNPSLAGIFTGDIRVQAVYRDQWNSVTTAYKTASLNGEYKMPVGKGDDFLTTGLQVLYDQAGTASWKTTHILPALNYHKSLSSEINRYLSVGFMAGVVQQNIDRSKVITNSSYNGGSDGENFANAHSYFDAAAGISFNSQLNSNPDNNFFIGAGYHHFNRPNNSFYDNQSVEVHPKLVLSGGIKFSVTEASYITLQSDYSIQGDNQEVIGGALYGIKLGEDLEKPKYSIHAGAFLRWNDAFIPVVKLDYRPFSVAFSYDVNVSKLKTSSMGRGGFELSVSYVGFAKRNGDAPQFSLCPRF
jgi:type IX secretion system PorP/SprF family membrane protein